VLGRFLKANTRRESVVIATKVHGVMRDEPNGRGLSRKAILFELDQSLKRLETDYVDLYQIHRWDYETPIEETLEALHDVVKAGKVRYIGASSMYAWQFAKALYLADLHGLDALRLHAEPLQPALPRRRARDDRPVQGRGHRRHSLEPAGARDASHVPWKAETTLRSETDDSATFLYGGTEEADHKVVDRLGEVAGKRGIPRAQVALAWLLAKPGVTAPIVGATKAASS
jgi:1-deoxyxylulose-5-phosphate synthase